MNSSFFWFDIALYVVGGCFTIWAVRRGWPDRSRVYAAPTDTSLRAELLAIPVAIYFTAALIAQPFLLPTGDQANGAPTRTFQSMVNSGVQIAGLIACLWVGYRMTGGNIRRFLLGTRRFAESLRLSVGWWLASLSLCALTLLITEFLMSRFWPGDPPKVHETLQALSLDQPSAFDRIVLYLGALIVAPVTEECFFRGLILPAFATVLRSRAGGIVISALGFGLIHFSQPHAMPALFVFGLMLGLAYVWTGSLMVPILMHFLFNARTLAWHAAGVMPTGG